MAQKYAVVTGASSGVGGAISLELAKSGYFVALVGRNQEKLAEVSAQIKALKGESQIFPGNLNTTEGVDQLVSQLKQNTRVVNVLVNAAAIWHGENEVFAGRDFATFPESVVVDTMMVGLVSPMLLVHGLLSLMPAKSKVINITGTFESGGKGWLPYFVSKRGLEDFTLGLSQELADKDIRVNAISPSDVATPAYEKYFPQYYDDGIDPAEIAKFAVSLCASDSKITGKVFVMKKGQPVSELFHA